MKKFDQDLIEAFKGITGSAPIAYLYVIDGPVWSFFFGLIGVMFQKPNMLGIFNDKYIFIPTGKVSLKALDPNQAKTIMKSEVVNAKYRKFGLMQIIKITLSNGDSMNLIMNKLYRGLEGHGAGIKQLKTELGV